MLENVRTGREDILRVIIQQVRLLRRHGQYLRGYLVLLQGGLLRPVRAACPPFAANFQGHQILVVA